MIEKFEIVWSNDEKYFPIYPLPFEDRKRLNLLGYSNRFENFCYRLKCKGVTSADMNSLITDKKTSPIKERYKHIDYQIEWRETLIGRKLYWEMIENWKIEIEYLKLIRKLKIEDFKENGRYVSEVLTNGTASIWKHDKEYYWLEYEIITRLGSPKIKEKIKQVKKGKYEMLFNFFYWK